MEGRVSLSHAYDLANVRPDVTARLVEQMAELDVAWATVAPASGGTQFDLARMTEAGIRVGVGEDGQRTIGAHTAIARCTTARGSWRSHTGYARTG